MSPVTSLASEFATHSQQKCMKSLVTSLASDRVSTLHLRLSRKGSRFGVGVQGLRSWGWGLASGFRV